MRIRTVDIDEHILDKIEEKHGLTYEQVEEVCLYNEPSHLVRRARNGLYALFGRTFAGRYVLVILVPRGVGVYQVVMARDQTSEERRSYRTEKG